jgi:hypothetical protein
MPVEVLLDLELVKFHQWSLTGEENGVLDAQKLSKLGLDFLCL